MGQAIAGIFPLEFAVEKWDVDRLEESFICNYDRVSEEGGECYYSLKEGILLQNFADFWTKFYKIITNKRSNREVKYANSSFIENNREKFPGMGMNEFIAQLKEAKESLPEYYDYPHYISVLTITPTKYILFYSGSYKAFLEVYTTMFHMEKLLEAAVDNPLSKIARFGLFG